MIVFLNFGDFVFFHILKVRQCQEVYNSVTGSCSAGSLLTLTLPVCGNTLRLIQFDSICNWFKCLCDQDRPTIVISPVNSSYLPLFTHWERKHIRGFRHSWQVLPNITEWFVLICIKKNMYIYTIQNSNNTLTHSVKLQVQLDFLWSEPLCKCWQPVCIRFTDVYNVWLQIACGELDSRWLRSTTLPSQQVFSLWLTGDTCSDITERGCGHVHAMSVLSWSSVSPKENWDKC